MQGAWPKDYIGKEVFEHPSKTWSQVFVRWTWIDDWTPGNSDGALFWSPTALCGGGEYGIATYSFGHDKDNSNTFIRVEVSESLNNYLSITQKKDAMIQMKTAYTLWA
jgi:hypothetical protein